MRALLLLVAVAAIIAGSYSLYLAIYAYEPPPAELMINDGIVELKEGDSWQRITGNTALDQGATVRTKDGGATIVFFGASLLRLARDTEVTLTALDKEAAKVIVTQASGKTWSRVVKATGKHGVEKALGVLGLEDYELFLPSAVATVRGTSFSADADTGEITVVTGTVALKANSSDEETLVSNATARVEVSVTKDVAPRILVSPREADAFVDENIARDEEFVEEVIERIEADAGRAIRESPEPVRKEDVQEFVAEIRKETPATEEVIVLDERKAPEEPAREAVQPAKEPDAQPVRVIETTRDDRPAPIEVTRDEPIGVIEPRPESETAEKPPTLIEETPQEPIREPVAETKEEPQKTGTTAPTANSSNSEPAPRPTGSAGGTSIIIA